MRATIKAVNAELAKLDDVQRRSTSTLATNSSMPKACYPKDIMPDALHPNPKGYQIWQEAMQPLLDKLLK